MTALTDDLEVLSQALVTKIKANAATLVSTVVDSNGNVAKVTGVYYGDQEKVPTVASVCVEPGSVSRTPNGFYQQSQNDFVVYLLVYHSGIEVEIIRQQCDQIGSAVARLLHADLMLGGLVLHGYVASFESGYTYRANTLYRTCRLTYTAMSKTNLVPS